MTTKKQLMEVFGGVVRADKWTPLFDDSPSDVKIDDIDVEIWLDEYALFRGTQDKLFEFIAGTVYEEYDRRMNYYTCETDFAREFLSDAILNILTDDSPTMYKAGSFYQTMADMFAQDYIIYGIDDEYFVFDNADSKFDYDTLVDIGNVQIWDFEKSEIEELQKMIKKLYIKNK